MLCIVFLLHFIREIMQFKGEWIGQYLLYGLVYLWAFSLEHPHSPVLDAPQLFLLHLPILIVFIQTTHKP